MTVKYLDWDELTEIEELQLRLNTLERDLQHLDENSIEFKKVLEAFHYVGKQLEELTGENYW